MNQTLTPANSNPPVVPDHELLRRVGRGSYGEVWLARNVMGSFRAIKVVYRASFESERPYEREFSGLQKFEPVSRTHPNLVSILHMGRNAEAGYFYCVMEVADDLADGLAIVPERYQPRSLASEMGRRGRLPVGECIELGRALAGALGHLHARGLVHRDIKPSNIIFTNGVPKLADIGLVTQIGSRATFVGTEGYLPPEGPGTPSADLYSLARVLYEIGFGKSQEQFPDLPTRLRELPDASQLMRLNRVILKACDLQPAKRFRSAEEFCGALTQLDLELRATGQAGSCAKAGQAGGKIVILHQVGMAAETDLAGALAERLRSGGFAVFVDEQSELNVDWARQVEQELREAQAVIALLSSTSAQSDLLAYALEIARQASVRPPHLPRILTVELDPPEDLPPAIMIALATASRIPARPDAAQAIEETLVALHSRLTASAGTA